MSLRDNVTDFEVERLSKKYDLTKDEVVEQKENYLSWINKSSGNPKMWGKNMLMYVEDFCKKASSKKQAKLERKPKKDKHKSMFDEINEQTGAFPEYLGDKDE